MKGGSQAITGALHHFRIYGEPFSPNDLKGTDDPENKEDLNRPKFSTATVFSGRMPLRVTETRESCTNSFNDQHAQKDPVKFCARLCFNDPDCKYFSAYTLTFRSPGRCCFYSDYKTGRTTASSAGFFALTRLAPPDDTASGFGQVMQHLRAEKCDFQSFTTRLKQVDVACCGGNGACPGGVPTSCEFICAEKYVPLFDRCHELLAKMMGKKMFAFNRFHGQCLKQSGNEISRVFKEARAKKNCIWNAAFVDERGLLPTPDGTYKSNHKNGHRRRVQHFGGIEHSNKLCPFDKFTARAKDVNTACHLSGSNQRLPSGCSPACAVKLNPFVADCHDLIARFLDDEIKAFDDLHKHCHDIGVSTALYMIESMDCDNTPFLPVAKNKCPAPVRSSCSEIKKLDPRSKDGYYNIDPDGPGGVPPFSTWCDTFL